MTTSATKISCLLLVFAVILEALPQKELSDKYDHIDVEAVLRNTRTLNNYIKCVLDQGSCTPEGRDLKEHIPENLKSKCGQCSPRQMKVVKDAVRYMVKNRPEDWQKIVDHYDKQHQYIDGFMEEFINQGD